MIRCCLVFIAVAKFTLCQVIPYGAPNRPLNGASGNRGMPNAMAMGRSMQNGVPMARNFPMAANNMANANLVNAQNFASNPYYGNNNLPNNLAYGNMASPNLANLANGANPIVTNANQVLANEMTVAALVKDSLMNGNLRPNVASPAILENNVVESNNPLIETGNIANPITYTSLTNGKNSNLVKYNFGNDVIPVTVSAGTPSNLPLGIRILADNLEVGGTVSVIGRMPILGSVTINGNVPTDGTASVNYNCGKPAPV